MNEMFLLIKAYFLSSFRINRLKYEGDSKARTKAGGITVLIGFSYVMIAVLVGFYSFLLASVFSAMGAMHLLLSIMAMAASVFTLFTTIYKVDGLVFQFRDYDMLMSLPFRTRTVIASRMVILYLMNLVFTALVMVPASIVFCFYVPATPLLVTGLIVGILTLPLLPISIATLIGTLIAAAAARFERKNIFSMIFTILLMLLIMAASFGMSSFSTSGQQAEIATSIAGVVSKVYPIADWFSLGIVGNVLNLILYLLISILPFALVAWVLSKFYSKLNAWLSSSKKAVAYDRSSLRAASATKALLRREWKMYFSMPWYVMNTITGPLLLTIGTVVVLVGGKAIVGSFAPGLVGESLGAIAVVAPIGMSFLTSLSCTTAPSVSLEGKRLWLLRSLPFSSLNIIATKIKMNLLLVLPVAFIDVTILCIFLQPALPTVLLMYITPAVYSVFFAMFGMYHGLRHVNLNWTSEMVVIKQSAPVMIAVITAMVLTMVPLFISFALMPFALYIALALTVILALASIGLWRSLRTKGVALFEAL